MLRDWRTRWADERHPKIKALMQNSLDAPSYAGQAFSENVGIGTAGSARKMGTPYRGTSQRSLPIKSLMSSAKGLFPPALKGGVPSQKA